MTTHAQPLAGFTIDNDGQALFLIVVLGPILILCIAAFLGIFVTKLVAAASNQPHSTLLVLVPLLLISTCFLHVLPSAVSSTCVAAGLLAGLAVIARRRPVAATLLAAPAAALALFAMGSLL